MAARRKTKAAPEQRWPITVSQQYALSFARCGPLVLYVGFWRHECELGGGTLLPSEVNDLASRGLLKIKDGHAEITDSGRMAI